MGYPDLTYTKRGFFTTAYLFTKSHLPSSGRDELLLVATFTLGTDCTADHVFCVPGEGKTGSLHLGGLSFVLGKIVFLFFVFIHYGGIRCKDDVSDYIFSSWSSYSFYIPIAKLFLSFFFLKTGKNML